MGRLLILLVLAASASSGILFLRSSAPTATNTAARTYAASDAAAAREIAMTGLGDAETTVLAQMARYEPIATPDGWDGAYADGTFVVAIAEASDRIEITSEGTVRGEMHRVRRAYKPEASAPPPFMVPALTAGNNLHLRDAVTITTPPPVNTGIHANGNLHITGRPTLVNGFGTAGRNTQNRTGAPDELILLPHSNPSGLPVLRDGVPEVLIPEVDVAPFQARADVVIPRNGSIGGRLVLGTREAPVILYAVGNLKTSAPLTIEGWGMIVVENNFAIDHAITTVGAPGANELMVVAGNSLHVNEPLTVSGNWYAGNNAHFDEAVRFERGTVTARNNIHFRGPLTMDYRGVAPELSGLVWPDHMVPRSHREW